MRIAVVGAGVCGLTAAYFLGNKGHEVYVFEKENILGGLAGSFKKEDWQWPLERYYHHFFSSDKEVFSLARELDLQEKLFFKTPKTSIFVRGKIYAFDTASAVLSFPLLNIIDKLRVGFVTGVLKINPFWQPLENITACQWLKKYYGRKAYQILWEPLLKAKFGKRHEEIPASWFWARIKKRSNRLGYFEGGLQTLINAMASKIKENKGKIFLDTEIKNLNDLNNFDRIIITTPPAVFLKTSPGLPENYKAKIQDLESVGAITLILSLKEKFLKDDTYWLNINEVNFPFVAVVEQTNFIDPQYYGGNHILYIGGYYPQNHPFFKMTKEQIYQKFLPFLKKINPNFNFQLCTSRNPRGSLLSLPTSGNSFGMELFANLYAQPVIPLNYSKQLPSFTTPVPDVFLATMHHIYPWDRGVNYAIKLGKKITDEIIKNN